VTAEWVAAWGLPGLGLAAFLAATVLPFSSEVAVYAALAAGWPPWAVLAWASAGNCAGALSTYALGLLFAPRALARLTASPAGRRALAAAHRWGPWTLVGSWLPVVGDPLLLVAGLLRFPWPAVVALGLGLRVARYAALVLATAW
jgi:membrane protein YqaA with SNARE-associated domain